MLDHIKSQLDMNTNHQEFVLRDLKSKISNQKSLLENSKGEEYDLMVRNLQEIVSEVYVNFPFPNNDQLSQQQTDGLKKLFREYFESNNEYIKFSNYVNAKLNIDVMIIPIILIPTIITIFTLNFDTRYPIYSMYRSLAYSLLVFVVAFLSLIALRLYHEHKLLKASELSDEMKNGDPLKLFQVMLTRIQSTLETYRENSLSKLAELESFVEGTITTNRLELENDVSNKESNLLEVQQNQNNET